MSVGEFGIEPTLRHQEVELLRHLLHRALGRAVPAIRLGDDRRDAPEQILRLLDGLPLVVLDQVALLENGARVTRERDWTGWRVDWQSHRVFRVDAVLGRVRE